MAYQLIKKEGRAKRGRLETVHGVIETPVFMNVGTTAAIKGAVSTDDLRQIKTQVELSNTYHLHVRPGDKIVKQLGGLHKFMNWDKPILTDSAGRTSQDQRRGRNFPVSYRRTSNLHGSGREHADSVESWLYDRYGVR